MNIYFDAIRHCVMVAVGDSKLSTSVTHTHNCTISINACCLFQSYLDYLQTFI